MDQEQVFNYFKLPSEQTDSTFLIGILDASGSMSSYWPYLAESYNAVKAQVENCLTITFDMSAFLKGDSDILPEINKNGGGGTNMASAFELLNKLLLQHKSNVTVLFVSDGQDSQGGTEEKLKKLVVPPVDNLNFICLGVGKGFPTFVSMTLREKYHNGDKSMPPLFLARTYDDATDGKDRVTFLREMFRDQLQGVSQHLRHRKALSVPPCLAFPWSEASVQQWAGSWVLSYQHSLQLGEVELNKVDVQVGEIFELAKYWLQNLQILALKGDVQQYAKIAYKELMRLQGPTAEPGEKKKLSFAERVYLKHCKNPLMVVLKEIRQLSESNFLAQLTPEEAAQRLAIGTVTGKYHNNAIKIKGVTVDDYVKDRNTFIEVLTAANLTESDSERSVISLENQKEILMQPDFIDGLKACPSQYDLVTTLSLIGYGLLVKRTDGSRINPWLIQVHSMAKHHKYVDTTTIQNAEDHVLKLSVGDGELEQINCVLPLYTLKDEDLSPILRSNLFHMMMTFNVMENVDTCFDTAYAALMANCLLYLINQPESQWKSDLIKLIEETYQLTYEKKYNFYSEALQNTPNLALVTDHPEVKTKCEDPSKAILVLHMIRSKLTQEQIKVILDRIFIEAIARMIPGDANVQDHYSVSNIEQIGPQLEQCYNKHIETILKSYPDNLVALFYTEQNLKDDLKQKCDAIDLLKEIDLAVQMDYQKLNKQIGGYKYNLLTLQNMYQHFNNGQKYTKELLTIALYHSQINNSYQRATQAIEMDTQKILAQVKLNATKDFVQQNPIFERCFKILSEKYFQQMLEFHNIVIPIKDVDVQQFCIQNNLENTYKFNQVSNLLTNACLAPQCPHFMKLHQSLGQHFKEVSIPGYHKTIKACLGMTVDETYEHILKGTYLEKINGVVPIISEKMIQYFTTNKQDEYQAIERVRAEYKKM